MMPFALIILATLAFAAGVACYTTESPDKALGFGIIGALLVVMLNLPVALHSKHENNNPTCNTDNQRATDRPSTGDAQPSNLPNSDGTVK